MVLNGETWGREESKIEVIRTKKGGRGNTEGTERGKKMLREARQPCLLI